MKVYAIVIRNNSISESGYSVLKRSSKEVDNQFEINRFDAIPTFNCNEYLKNEGITWTYPWDKAKFDLKAGLKLTPYRTKNKLARISCFLSHYSLWKTSMECNEPIMILEHDARFNAKWDISLDNVQDCIIGINNPLGATRKSSIFYNAVIENTSNNQFISAPWVDQDRLIPQGLAGNSAYIIFPNAARKAIKYVKDLGAWPNDALLCKQLFGPNLLVTKKFYTHIQGLPSTTS